MRTSTALSERHHARRARLGIHKTVPLVKINREPKKPIVRDILVLTLPEPEPDTFLPKPQSGLDMEIPQPFAWRQIIREVCEKHGITYLALCSARRARSLVIARHEVCYRLRNETAMSYPQIGRRLGGRDHTTVISSIQRYERMLEGEEYRDTHGNAVDVSTANKEKSE